MQENIRYSEEDLPFIQLERIGIDRATLQRMPREVTEPLLGGAVTPLIQARIETRNGYSYAMPMKLQLVRDADGRLQAMAYPMHREVRNTLRLTAPEMDAVRSGGVIRKTIAGDDGIRRQRYVQVDAETRSLMYRDAATVPVSQRLKDMEKIRDIELGQNQKEAAQEGKPVELAVGDEKVTVGVDLREPQGFKVVRGDMDEWRRQQLIRYDEAHPEVMGYVQTDKNRWEFRQIQLEKRSQGLQQSERKEETRQRGIGR